MPSIEQKPKRNQETAGEGAKLSTSLSASDNKGGKGGDGNGDNPLKSLPPPKDSAALTDQYRATAGREAGRDSAAMRAFDEPMPPLNKTRVKGS